MMHPAGLFTSSVNPRHGVMAIGFLIRHTAVWDFRIKAESQIAPTLENNSLQS